MNGVNLKLIVFIKLLLILSLLIKFRLENCMQVIKHQYYILFFNYFHHNILRLNFQIIKIINLITYF
jgi:hypothetical protein